MFIGFDSRLKWWETRRRDGVGVAAKASVIVPSDVRLFSPLCENFSTAVDIARFIPNIRPPGKQMQIDFVITDLRPGGAERCLCELAIGLKKRHHRVRVFSLQSLPRDEKNLLVSRLEDSLVHIATADANRVWNLPRAINSLREFWHQHDADVVQTFLHHANVLGSVMARRHTIGKVVGGVRVAQPNQLRSRIERLATARMDAVVCVSDAVADFAMTNLGATQSQVRVIGNGVNVRRFENSGEFDWQTLQWPRDAIVILFAGRMDPQKNLDAVFEAGSRWLDADPRRRLLFVGDGSESSRVETFCDSIKDQRAKHLGWTADIASIMGSSRVLVMPSHYEGMANVALEAMAAARPVVCSAVEGSLELFSAADVSRRQRQSYPPGDQAAFERLVDKFCSDSDLADQIGQDNHRHVTQHHLIANMVDQYEMLYRELTGS